MLKWCWTCWSETTHLLCLLTCACGIEKQKQTWRMMMMMMIDQQRFNLRLRLPSLNPGMVFKYRSLKTWTEVRWLKLFVNMQHADWGGRGKETCWFTCCAFSTASVVFQDSHKINYEKHFERIVILNQISTLNSYRLFQNVLIVSVDFVRHFLSKNRKHLLFSSLLCLYLTFPSYF